MKQLFTFFNKPIQQLKDFLCLRGTLSFVASNNYHFAFLFRRFKLLLILLVSIVGYAQAATITWTNGNATGLWSDPLNWDSGTVPGASDDVVFDGNVSNASCTVDVVAAAQSLSLNTSGSLLFQQNLSLSGDLTIDAVNKLYCSGAQYAITTPANLITNDNNYWRFNAGSINIIIRLNGSTDQSISGTGELHNLDIQKTGGDVLMQDDLNLSIGTLTGSGLIKNSGGILSFINSYGYNWDFDGTVDEVVFNTTGDVLFYKDMVVNGDVTIDAVNKLYCSGAQYAITTPANLITNDNNYWRFNAGSINIIIRLNGSTDQSISGTGELHNLDIQKTGGDVLMQDDLNLSIGTLTGSGLIKNSGGILSFINSYGYNWDFDGTVDEVVFNTTGDVLFYKDMVVNGDVTIDAVNDLYCSGAQYAITTPANLITNDNNYWRFNAGSINIIIRLVGNADQSISGTGELHNLDIQKTGGDVLMQDDLNLSIGTLTGSGLIKNSGGILSFINSYGYNWDFEGTVDEVVFNTTGDVLFYKDMVVNGDVTIDAVNDLYCSGAQYAITTPANLITNDNNYWRFNAGSINIIIRLNGSTDQSISGTGELHNLDIQKTGGDVLMQDDLNLSIGTLTGSGLIKNSGGILRFINSYGYNWDFDGTVDEVVFNTTGDVLFYKDMVVNGDVTIDAVNDLYCSGAQYAITTPANLITNDNNYWRSNAGSINIIIRLTGSTDQSISGTGKLHQLAHAKTGGDVLFDATFGKEFYNIYMESGTWLLDEEVTLLQYFYLDGGTLKGTGPIQGNVVGNGGTLAPGASPGCFIINGNLTMNTGSTLDIEIEGDTPCTQHDQLVVNGTVNISGATLTGTTTTAPSAPITIIDNDLADNIGGSKFSGAPEGSTFNVGGTDYIISYTGGDGNDFTLTSNTPPTAVCQDITINADANCVGIAAANDFDNGSSDPEDGVPTLSISPAGPYDLGATTVTLTATDSQGETSTCEAEVTVVDVTDPTITCPADVITNTDAGLCDVTGLDLGIPIAADNCEILTSNGLNFDGINDRGTIPTDGVLALTDFCTEFWVKNTGNDGTADRILKMNNFEIGKNSTHLRIYGLGLNWISPTTLPQNAWVHIAIVRSGTNLTVYKDGVEVYTHAVNTTATLPSNWKLGTQSVHEYGNFSIDELRVWNVARTQAQISANMNSELSAQSNLVLLYHFNQGTANGNNAGINIVNDDSGNGLHATLTNFALNGTSSNWTDGFVGTGPSLANNAPVTFSLGATTVIWTATDGAGNTATCEQIVTVEDNEAPTALCQDITIQLDASGNGSTTAAAIDNGSSDNCGIQSVEIDVTTFDCDDVGVSGGPDQALDFDGFDDYAISSNNISILGTQPTTIELWVKPNGGGGYDSPIGIGANKVYFNLNFSNNTYFWIEGVNSYNLGTLVPDGQWTHLAVSYDGAGTFYGFINGTPAPIPSKVFSNGGYTGPVFIGTRGDLNPNTFWPGSVDEFRVWNVQKTQTEIQASMNNSLTGTESGLISYYAMNDGPGSGIVTELVASNTATLTNMDPNTDWVTGALGPSGSTGNTVLLTVTDDSGNTSTCQAEVTVEDNILPTINCPADIIVDTDLGVCTASGVALGSPIADDNCSFEVTNDAPATYPIGTTTVTWTVTDASGNTATCEQIVTVEDNEAPMALCQDITVALDANGLASITEADINNGSSDNCGIQSVEIDVNSFDCDDINIPAVQEYGVVTVNYVGGSTSYQLTQANLVNWTNWSGCPPNQRFISSTGLEGWTWTDNLVPGTVVNSVDLYLSFDLSGTGATRPYYLNGINEGTSPGPNDGVNCASVIKTFNLPGTNYIAGGNNTFSWDFIPSTYYLIEGSAVNNTGITVTLTVTDDSGNTSTCQAEVTVEDNILPTINCPADIIVDTDLGVCTASGVALGSPIADDNCSFEVTNDAPATYPIGTTTVTWTVTDASGNTATCEQIVTVEDNEAPTALCQDITVALDANGLASITEADINNGSSDNCGIQSVEIDVNSFDCDDINIPAVQEYGVVTVNYVGGSTSYQLTQANLVNWTNWSGCPPNQRFISSTGLEGWTWTDNLVPGTVVNSVDLYLSFDLSGTGATRPYYLNGINEGTSPGPNDGVNCASVIKTFNLPGTNYIAGGNNTFSWDFIPSTYYLIEGSAVNNTGITVTLTVTDDSGNTSTCQAEVTVEDNILPTINCPADIIVDTDLGVCTASGVALGSPIADDNCSFEVTNDAPATYPIGTTTVTWTVTDAAGNTATCEQIVTVEDNEAPTITCPADLTVDTDAGVCEATNVTLGTPSTSDNCSGETATNDAPAAYLIGDNTVTWTVTDASGNTATCEQIVTVEDNEAPTITCPSDITLDTGPGLCEATVTITEPTVSDNCSVLSLGNGLSFDGVDDIAFIASSSVINTQNQTKRTAEVYFRVDDKNISSHKQVVWEEGGSVNGLNIYVYNGQLYMGLYSGSTGWNPIGSWVSTSAIQSGQWHNAVLVFDGNLPAGERLKGYLDGNLIGTTSTSGNTLHYHPGQNAVGGLYNNGVFHDGVDYSTFGHYFGGDIDEVRLWTVARTEAELQATNTVQLVGNEPGLVLYYTMDQGTACADNSGINFLDDMTSTGLNGTLQGFNLDGSTGCNSNWTTGAPVLNSEITLTNDYTGTASASSSYPVGSTTVTYTATDEAGNEVMCSFTVTVEDNEAPTITCPADVTVDTDLGSCEATNVVLGTPTTSDNCTGETATNDAPAAYLIGDNTVTWTVTDAAGNTATCEQVVTVEDNEAPTITCPASVTVDTDLGTCEATNVALGTPSTSDNCTGETATNDAPATYPIGTTTVTWTVTDASGNTVTCAQVVTVEDNETPTITCPADVTVDTDPGTCEATNVALGTPSTSDNCFGETATNDAPAAYLIGDNTVTWTVTDAAGNTATCEQIVTVEDNEAPTITCPAEVTVLCVSDIPALDINTVSSSDNCSVTVTHVGDVSDGGNQPELITRTYRATDDAGNFVECSHTITVQDPDPIFAISDVSLCEGDSGETDYIFTIELTNDVCSSVDVTYSTADLSAVDGMDYNGVVDALTGSLTFGGFDISRGGSTSLKSGSNMAAVRNQLISNLPAPVFTETNTLTTAYLNTIDVLVISAWPKAIILSASEQAALLQFVTDGGALMSFQENGGWAGANTQLSNESFVDPFGMDMTPNNQNASPVTIFNPSANPATDGPFGVVTSFPVSYPGWYTNLGPYAQCLGNHPLGCGIAVIDPGVIAPGSGGVLLIPDGNGATGAGISSIGTLLLNSVVSITATNGLTFSGVAGEQQQVTLTSIGDTDVEGDESFEFLLDYNGTTYASATGTILNDDCMISGPALVDATTDDYGYSGPSGMTSYEWSVTSGNATLDVSSGQNITVDVLCENYTLQLDVVDPNGCSYTCTLDVIVNDNEAPEITCPADVTVDTDPGTCEATNVDLGTPTTSDNCSGETATNDAPASYLIGDNTVTWTVTDAAGNTATCEQIVTVQDNEAPEAICQSISVYLDANGNASITADDIDDRSDDACEIDTLLLSAYDFTCTHVGANTVILTAIDVNGNQDTCSTTVTVLDTIAPMAICQDITIALDSFGIATIVADDIDGGSNDACGVQSIAASVDSFDCSMMGRNDIVLTVTDVNGNVSTCTAEVEIIDTIAPVVVCKNITVQLDDTGNATITADDIDNGSNDACGILGLEIDNDSFDCTDIGLGNTVVLTVTDNNGNINTCEALITVEDNVHPTAICQDVTIQLDASGQANITANDVNNGSSDACGIADISIDIASFTCSQEGANTVTLTVEDVNGNISTCTSTVTVEDNVAPIAICQDITVQLDAFGHATITADAIDNGSNDACGIQSIVLDDYTFDCSDIGVNPVVLTVTDNNNNSEICNATVTIEDHVHPIAICQDITIQLDAAGNASITVNDVDNGSNDACGIESLAIDMTAFDCGDVGPNTVTLTVTDVNGNISTCTSTVTVEDNVDPVAICQDITVQLDATGNVSITADDVDNGSNDACGIQSLVVSETAFDCNDIGGNPVTLTVTDNNNNEITCNATVTVEDNVDPIALCQNLTIQLDAFGNASITPEMVDNGSNDACGIDSLSLDISSFDCNDVGENTVVLTVVDNNGNVSTCSSTVTIEDNVDPVALCQNVTVILDAYGNGSITTMDVDNGSSDACGIQTITLDEMDFNCADVGPNTVTLTVTDNNGNVSTCTSSVTVIDTVAPIAICQNITVELDENGQVSITPTDVDNGSNDACGLQPLAINVSNFDCSNVGENTVILTVTDVNGNVSTCESTVTVEDNEAPTFSACPSDQTVEATMGDCSQLVSWIIPTVDDNCDVSMPVFTAPGINFSTFGPSIIGQFPVGTTTVTMTVTDANDNASGCTFDITVEDNQPPIITNCPADIVVNNDEGSCDAEVLYGVITASDNCPGVILDAVSGHMVDGGTFSVGTTSVLFRATDAEGLITECAFDVTVIDEELPVVTCQDVTISLDNLGNGMITANDVFVGATDNCEVNMSSLSVDISSFDCSNVGNVTVTVSIEDIYGNVGTCTANVTVIDEVDPEAICNNLVIDLDENGEATITAEDVNNGSSDACGIESLTIDVSAFDCNDTGSNDVILTVTDNNGNVSTCTSTITIQDVELPNIVCPGDINVNNDTLSCGAIVDFTATADDNCSAVVTYSKNPGTFFSVGTTTVTATATDPSGNIATCTFDVMVVDNEVPYIACPADLTLNADNGDCFSTSLLLPTFDFDDNCEIASFTNDVQSSYPVGVSAIEYVLEDIHGNISTCTQLITVVDNQAPTVVCNDITIDLPNRNDYNLTQADIEAIGQGSSDNCTDISYVITNGVTTYNCDDRGEVFSVTLMVTDLAGNASTCTANVTIIDSQSVCNDPPMALCQNIVSFTDENCEANITADQIDGGSTDPDGDELTFTLDNYGPFGVGIYTVTLYTTDGEFVDSCTATVEVYDFTPPNAVCQDITIQLDASGNASIVASDVDGGSTDACGIESLEIDVDAFTCENVGLNTVTLTVTDVNGMVNTCEAVVTIEDTVDPVAMCQDITVQLDASGNASITAEDVDGGSTDACGIQSLTIDDDSFDCSDVGGGTANNYSIDLDGQNDRIDIGTSVMPAGSYTKEAWVIAHNSACRNILSASNGHQLWLFNRLYAGHGTSYSIVEDPDLFPLNSWQHVAVSYDSGNGEMKLYRNGILVDVAVTAVAQNPNILTQIGSHNGCVFDGEMDEVRIWEVVRSQTDIQNAMNSTLSGTESGLRAYYPMEDGTGSSIATDQSGNGYSGTLMNMDPNTDWMNSSAPVSGGTTGQQVVLTVTDNNGNTSTCTATVTVEDNVDPIAICQDITVQLDAAGNTLITANDVDGGSSDACGIESLTIDEDSFDCGDVGQNTVTLTVTDNNGNVSTCTSTVTVEDSVDPVAQCQDITVQLDASGNVSITAADVDSGSDDACNIQSLVIDIDDFECGDIGANTVTLTVTDNNGNISTCTSNVTVEDNVDPTALCKEIDVYLDASGNAIISPNDINNGSNDACGIDDMSINVSSFSCGDVGANTVTLTVMDNHGNQSTCDAIVNVLDEVAPVAICQDITIQLDASGAASITPADIDNGSSDACGIDSLSINVSEFNCFHVGNNAVTLTVTDNNGNVSTCLSNVTVEDSVAPEAICKDITVQLNASGTVNITANSVNNGSNDACGIQSISIDDNSFGCEDVGENTVVLTVTDANGNVSTCTSTVTVEDNIDPIALCKNITIQLDATGNASISPSDVNNNSNDACGIADLSIDVDAFDCSNVGANVVILTITDENGNASTCSSTVTIQDNIDPVAICQDITVQLDGSGNVSIAATDVNNGSNDACGIQSLSINTDNFNCGQVGPNNIILSVTDNNGNLTTCMSTVTVEDNVNPVAICQDITVQLDATGNIAIAPEDVNNGSNDACGIQNLEIDIDNFACSNEGENTVTLTVTDENGNQSTCTSTVTVEDNVAPIAICQDITIQLDASGNASITANDVDGGSNDACGIDILTLDDDTFNCADVGSNTVVLTVTDNNGNISTCAATVMVEDNVDPVIQSPATELIVECDGSGNTADYNSWLNANGNAVAADACGVSWSNSMTTVAGCGTNTETTVTFTASDPSGNQVSTTALFKIVDTTAPEMTCPNDIATCADQGLVTGAVVTWNPVTPTDICNAVTITSTHNSGDIFPVGITSVTYTAVDACGNTTVCTFNVTVYELPIVSISEAEESVYCQGDYVILTASVSSNTGGITYNWATGENTQSINVNTSGSYSVVVSDSNGCTRETAYSVSISQEDLLSSYVILAEEEVYLKYNNIVLNGGVGVFDFGGKAKIKSATDITGPTTFVKADILDINSSNVTVQISNPVSVGLPPFLTNNMPSNNDITVAQNTTVTLTDQVYGKVKIKKNATVTFTQKDIFIEELDIDDDAIVEFTGCAFVRVSDKIDIEEDVTINTTGAQVWFYSEDKVDIKEGALINANIFALGHDIKVKGKSDNPSFMNGQFIGRKVKGEKYVTWDWGNTCNPGCIPDQPDVEICNASGEDSSDEWIESIVINGNINITGNDGGYGDYTDEVLSIVTGSNTVSLSPGFSGSAYKEYWRVWIDLNNDGDFDDNGEKVFYDNSYNSINGTFNIPNWATSDTTIMRIAMKYGGSPSPCETFEYGEVEDYSVLINFCDNVVNGGTIGSDQILCENENDPEVITNINSANGGSGAIEYLWLYNTTSGDDLPGPGNMNGWVEIQNSNASSYNPGPIAQTTWYLRCARRAGCINYPGESNVVEVVYTPTCQIIYCDSEGNNSNYEWIDEIGVNGNDYHSGNDGGYGDHRSIFIPLSTGINNVELTPGFSSSSYYEYWTIWIDLNADGDFEDADEEVFNGSSSNLISGTMNIPLSAVSETTMRISMKYDGWSDPCETFAYGEVEDYSVVISYCDNVLEGGAIGTSTELCGDDNDPDEIISIEDATGGSGNIEYLWLYNTETSVPPTFNNPNGWVEIPNSNSPTYDPGEITESTCYLRCARREGCTNFVGESNVVTVTYAPSCEIEYCDSQGNSTTYEWIQKVKVGNINNNSGDNGGYADFTSQSTSIAKGNSKSITLKPGFAGSKYKEYWRVWVDWNQDGDFDDYGEEEVQKASKNSISKYISVPENAILGTTTMRVSMKYGGYPEPCEQFGEGEVEDYSIIVTNGSDDDDDDDDDSDDDDDDFISKSNGINISTRNDKLPVSLEVYPNPTRGILTIELDNALVDKLKLSILDSKGQSIRKMDYNVSRTSRLEVDMNDLPNGLYQLVMIVGENVITKKVIKVE